MASKIEKTLELNITHEILNLADSFWWYLQPIALHRYWRPHWRFPLINGPKSFATGLHINKEGKAGGGYDVCIHSPVNFGPGKPRLMFMQFKAGVEMPFVDDPKSLFYGSETKKNIHVSFDINSNKKNDQHKLLQDLAAQAGNTDAVLYVFPRIVDEKQLQQHLGRLLKRTSFVPISEIDTIAAKSGVTIDDGSPHKFRTCYIDPKKSEVNRFFFFFGGPQRPGQYLGELFAVRMQRALVDLKTNLLEEFQPYRGSIIDAMIRHLLTIANHFQISRESFYTNLAKYDHLIGRLGYHHVDDSLKSSPEPSEVKEEDSIFSDIVESVSVYLEWVANEEYFDKRMSIPNAPSNVSIEIPEEGIHFNQLEFDDETLESITYQIF